MGTARASAREARLSAFCQARFSFLTDTIIKVQALLKPPSAASAGALEKETNLPSFIRNPQDFWSGVIFLIFGLAAVIIGNDYAMGSAGRMGPAYFPTALGSLLAVIGAVSLVRSFIRHGEPIGRFAIKNLLLVTAAVLLFGLLMRGAGLLIATVVLVMLSGYASIKFKVLPFLAVAVGMAVFCILVFVVGLGLPMPIFGSWFGF
ncbi:tripartite tricarboxylate transporter TctB family protein [Noviherbaspirillum malthae]|jgi:putative tricarboxylic transport membrane protein|uniref:tripartite tricarboxylate transporter TctB family protein n=1 Tax=Noviherbaspirillum malthae TaxID=1260987 RepID=UPI002B268582|nr:tripartite tricarboxylate transporter TctB family protein [Noviherbaspirillum malthae]